ncbi:MAG: hypothetical protein ACRBN8_23510 [Nannocystales bacterium]
MDRCSASGPPPTSHSLYTEIVEVPRWALALLDPQVVIHEVEGLLDRLVAGPGTSRPHWAVAALANRDIDGWCSVLNPAI